jgi:sulfur relay (sulfurtransferase) complex TusBCD TusD component (DsrE family)
MADYILIESRDPFESAEVGRFLELAEGLAREGSEVTLFLVQNAVLAARHDARGNFPLSAPLRSLAALAADGVKVLADSFSLQERGISPNRLIPGVTVMPLSSVIDHMAAGCKALWH